MGFFDKFKKNNKTNNDLQTQKEPLVLNYTNGTRVEVDFQGLVDIQGENAQKTVHQVIITSIDANGKFTVKQYFLEPIPYTSENGEVIDGTEMYYKQLGSVPKDGEDRSQYNAVKGFFKGEYLDILESNYIGNLAMDQNGEYIRHYDSGFKSEYDMLYKEQQEEVRRIKQAKHLENEKNINKKVQGEVDDGILKSLQKQVIPPEQRKSVGEVEILTPKKREDIENGRF